MKYTSEWFYGELIRAMGDPPDEKSKELLEKISDDCCQAWKIGRADRRKGNPFVPQKTYNKFVSIINPSGKSLVKSRCELAWVAYCLGYYRASVEHLWKEGEFIERI